MMDDSKQKLILLGGILGFIVLVFCVYIIATTKSNSSLGPEIDRNPPTERLVMKYDERTNYSDALKYYRKVLPKIKADTSNYTQKYWLSDLHKKHVKLLSTELRRFCRKDTLDVAHYKSLKDNTIDLINELKENENLKSQEKDVDVLLGILYEFYRANKLPKDISEGLNNAVFDEEKYNIYTSKIKKIENTRYVNENVHLTNSLKGSKDLLGNWKKDEERHTSFKSIKNHVEVIMTDCKIFNGEYYQNLCEERRFQSYFNHFTIEAKNHLPGEDTVITKYVVYELDCQLIRDAPLSPVLSRKDNDNREGNFYKDCIGIKKNYRNAK